MRTAEVHLHPRAALASRPDAATGWTGPGLTISESSGQSLAFIFVRANRVAQVRAVLADQLGIELPRDLHVATGKCLTLVSCGPGTYLAASFPGPGGISIANLQRYLGELATVVDYSDNLTVLTVNGPCAEDLVARLCSVDLQAREVPAQLGIVTLMLQVRTYLWRLTPVGPFTMAVPRSTAVGFWDALLLMARSADPASR